MSDNRIKIFVDSGGPLPPLDPKTHVYVNFIEPEDRLLSVYQLERLSAQPCLLYADDRDCPSCQAQRESELRRAAHDD